MSYTQLDFVAPQPGQAVEITEGVLWARLALPFALNHVNLFFLEDGAGWAVVDTGLGNTASKQAWESLLTGPLRGRPLTRIIGTHYHPDHIGLVGWLSDRFEVPLHMTTGDYFISLHFGHPDTDMYGEPHRRMYRRHGMVEAQIENVLREGHRYQDLITGLPKTYQRMSDGDTLDIGGRAFEVITGGGHSPEQAMLLCREDGLFLAADQVLDGITPNIAIAGLEPDGDPLGLFLRSLARIRREVPDDVLVLPGHKLPYITLHRRIDELIEHHRDRCDVILQQCRQGNVLAIDLVPHLFTREIDDHQMTFAFTETLAHVNMLIAQGRLSCDKTADVWHLSS